MRRLTQEEFIEKAKRVHGDRYGYSKVVYINNKKPVVITCPIHGDFEQTPSGHLIGNGCNNCAHEIIGKKTRKKIYGFDILDTDDTPTVKGCKNYQAYRHWKGMIGRCYSDYKERVTSYKDCKVCDEWSRFSNFLEWFDRNYINGCELDKDILVKGNKVYSPQCCCFIPQEINKLLIKRDKLRGDFPIGVYKHKTGSFLAQIHIEGKTRTIGSYKNAEEAFSAYKQAKESHVKEVAQRYYNDNKITKRVYNALMNYKVEITD